MYIYIYIYIYGEMEKELEYAQFFVYVESVYLSIYASREHEYLTVYRIFFTNVVIHVLFTAADLVNVSSTFDPPLYQ